LFKVQQWIFPHPPPRRIQGIKQFTKQEIESKPAIAHLTSLRRSVLNMWVTIDNSANLQLVVTRFAAHLATKAVVYPVTTVLTRLLLDGIRNKDTPVNQTQLFESLKSLVVAGSYRSMFDGFGAIALSGMYSCVMQYLFASLVAGGFRGVLDACETVAHDIARNPDATANNNYSDVFMKLFTTWADKTSFADIGAIALPCAMAFSAVYIEPILAWSSIQSRVGGRSSSWLGLPLPSGWDIMRAMVASVFGPDFSFM
jgi:hypothetical protein